MLSNRDRLALTGIRDNIRLAEEFAADLSVEALNADRRTQTSFQLVDELAIM